MDVVSTAPYCHSPSAAIDCIRFHCGDHAGSARPRQADQGGKTYGHNRCSETDTAATGTFGKDCHYNGRKLRHRTRHGADTGGSGAAVVIAARRKDRLESVAREIADQGGKVLAVAGDAGDAADIDGLLDNTLAWKTGRQVRYRRRQRRRGLAGGILTSDVSQWQELYRINVIGAAYLMRRSGQYMAERKRGDIVAISSVVARNLSPFGAFYGSSKAAVSVMAEAVRRDVAPAGVRVSIVMPGIAHSEFQQVAGYNEENFGNAVAQFGKLLEPQEIADAIRWLLTLPPT